MKNNKKNSKGEKTSYIRTISKSTAGKKSKKNKLPLYVVLGVLTFLLALTVAIGVFYAQSTPKIDDENPFDTPAPVVNTNPDDQNGTQNKRPVSADGRKQEMYNLMVVGKDYWSGSTDVIMIVSVNTANNSISVMQIPRDSTVDCGVNENHGKRVNAIYAYALTALRSVGSNPQKEYDDPAMAKVAPLYVSSMKDNKTAENRKYNEELRSKMALEYLRETLKRTFCIAIDGYVMVDVAGFREIVDVLGGVQVDVPQSMHYDDDEQNLHIHINKGLQTLNGKQAEGFVRYRYGYVDGDIGRVNAQKIFLAALAKKVMSFSTITKIQPLIETCFEYTTTSLTTSDIIGYVKILLGVDLSNIKFYTAPGEAYQTSSGAWYYSLYMDENLQLINQYFNDYDRPVTDKDVTLRQVVKNYNISYNNQGISAEEIDKSELNLTKSDVTYNPSTSSENSYTGGDTPQQLSPNIDIQEVDNEKETAVEASSDVSGEETEKHTSATEFEDPNSDKSSNDAQAGNTSDTTQSTDENVNASQTDTEESDQNDAQASENDEAALENETQQNDTCTDIVQAPSDKTEEADLDNKESALEDDQERSSDAENTGEMPDDTAQEQADQSELAEAIADESEKNNGDAQAEQQSGE